MLLNIWRWRIDKRRPLIAEGVPPDGTVAARGHMNRRTSEERGDLFPLSSEKEEKAKGLNYGRGPQA